MTIDLDTIEFLSTKQLAFLLGVSKTSVYRLIGRRQLPFYKIGHNIRFKSLDVLEFLEQNCIKSIT